LRNQKGKRFLGKRFAISVKIMDSMVENLNLMRITIPIKKLLASPMLS
jgi:hypothetical protein